jgi:hypothetical protein
MSVSSLGDWVGFIAVTSIVATRLGGAQASLAISGVMLARTLPAFVFGPSPAGMGGRNEAVSIEEFMAVVKVHCLSAYDYLSGASA